MTRHNHPAPELVVDRWFNCGQPLTIDTLRGRVVVIEAFQMLCPGCVAHGVPQAQRKEIGTELPPDFIAADRAFHILAQRLAQAGENGDPALERLWFQEMTRACQACHTDYAGARFPGLVPDGSGATE